MAKVSVIVPVHNVAPYVEKSVRSVMNQELEDIEIILVENCSTDGSYEICKRLAGEDKRIKLLKSDRADLSLARNTGIDASTAEFISFIDSDDLIDRDMLSTMYAAVTEYNADLAICNDVLEFPDGRVIFPYNESGEVCYYGKTEILAELLEEKICSSACVMLCRKFLFSKVRFPVGRYFEDHATTYRLVNAAENGGVYIGKSFYHYVHRSGSICHSLNFKKTFDFALGNAERIMFIEQHCKNGDDSVFDARTRRSILMYNINMFIDNFISAIRLVENEDDRKKLDILRAYIPVVLACKVVPGRTRYRLLRMRWLWPFFYLSHKK